MVDIQLIKDIVSNYSDDAIKHKANNKLSRDKIAHIIKSFTLLDLVLKDGGYKKQKQAKTKNTSTPNKKVGFLVLSFGITYYLLVLLVFL